MLASKQINFLCNAYMKLQVPWNLKCSATELQSLILQYNLENVYNADETALYWKLEPSKSLACGPVSGVKKPKDRITIMLACNLTGTHKLPAVFIHKYKNPRCILNVDKKTLPVLYYWNNSAWMQRSIFRNWIMQLNQEMRRKRKYILLLLDNVSTHRLDDNEQLSNVMLNYIFFHRRTASRSRNNLFWGCLSTPVVSCIITSQN